MGETGKRSRQQKENNGSNKNQRKWVDKEENTRDNLVAYRILCPDTVIGSVIGKAGKIINLIRQESRAKIKVVDPFPGAKDRVITIYCYVNEKVELGADDEYNNNGPLCPAQDALLKMQAAIANAVTTLGDPEKKQSGREECTILLPASQSANVIGKSGVTIKKMRAKTRAHVKVIPKDALDPTHSCAMHFDNFVQIAGDSEAVKRALFAVSTIIYKFPAKEQIPLDTSVPEMAPSIIIPADLPLYPNMGFYSGVDPIVSSRSAHSMIDALAPENHLPNYTDTGSMWPVVVPKYGGDSRPEELTIRLLCPSDIIGRVIGRGGSIIKSVRQASGSHVEVDDSKATKDKYNQCVITITSTESLDDVQSKAVEAVLLLQEKINDEDAENVTMRLLISSRNIGCIIGKSGSIINEIRKRSRADIRISKGEKTKSADDEYVEVSGEVKNVRDALIQIVLRLRNDTLNDKDGDNNRSVAADRLFPGTSALSAPPVRQHVPHANHLGYEPTQPRIESATGSGLWSSSDFHKYGSMSMGDDVIGPSYSSNKPYGGGLLPSSTLDMLIPSEAAGKVIGKNGVNISNIRQISGAVIEISELGNSHGDYVAFVSGTPEQKRSAENLIQAFIMAA